ncbi:MAG: hypothetical protein E6J26_06865, partial [Chloroflexi bacterium]
MKGLSLLTLLSAFAVGPLLAPGYFWGAHDARHSVYFLFEFNRAIGDGVWYPRWMPDFTFGYGYPFFNINSPLAYYLGEAFLKLGLDYVTATKIVFGLAVVLSGWAMYGFVRGRINERAALIAALVYVYAPYHLLDVYVRGALAETVALAVLPLCLWAFAETVERRRSAAVIGAGISYAALTLAHSGLALLFSLMLAAYLLMLLVLTVHRAQPLNRLTGSSIVPLIGHVIHVGLAPLLGLLLGIGLSAIYLLPSLTELGSVRTDQYLTGTSERFGYYDYHEHFSEFFQLFSPHWGYGLSQPGPHDDLSLQLGAAATLLALFSIVVVVRQVKWRASLTFFQVGTLALAFMMLPQSTLLWDHLPLVAFAQFPWRLLALAALTMAPLAGSVLADFTAVEDKVRILDMPTALLATLVLFSSLPYTTAQIIEPVEGPVSCGGLMKFEHNAGELTGSTAWVRTIPTWGPLADVYLNDEAPSTQVDYASLPVGIVVDSRGHSSIHDEVWVHAESDGRITFDRFMYPGWRAYLLDREHGQPIQALPVEPRGELGLLSVTVPRGEHFLLLRFE